MPLNTFDLQRMQDIQISDQGLQQEYIKKYQTGQINQAHQLLEQTLQLEGKAITASKLKAYVDAVNTLEKYYFENVNDILEALKDRFQEIANDIVLKGEYNPDIPTDYSVGNFVTYENETYFVVKDGTYSGDDINNSEYFLKLEGLRGEQGVTGTDTRFLGEYDSLRTYYPKDVVTYNNQLYVSKTTNTSHYPPDNPEDWMQALQVDPKGIDVGREPVEGISPGMFWWQVYGESYTPIIRGENPTVGTIDKFDFTVEQFDKSGLTVDLIDNTNAMYTLDQNGY